MTMEERERRENQRNYRKEQQLDLKNEYGISDPTPKAAIKNILTKAS